MDRDDIIAQGRKSKQMRASFLSDAKVTAHYIHPKNVASRWTSKQSERLSAANGKISGFTNKNRILITALGAGGLLLAGYRPISKLIRRKRARRADQE